jgi:hypothetical protein
MLFTFLSISSFSSSIARFGPVTSAPAGAPRPMPVVAPVPEDWAVPRLFVPGGDGGADLAAPAMPLGSVPETAGPTGLS